MVRNYLRMRGEYSWTFSSSLDAWELPPHARRIQPYGCMPTQKPGTTSACAENTLFWSPKLEKAWNYLRMRGEYTFVIVLACYHWELPPHARRIRLLQIFFHDGFGTTSACAENTRPHQLTPLLTWNYLRMRGEYIRPSHRSRKPTELPPHARRIPLMAPTRA